MPGLLASRVVGQPLASQLCLRASDYVYDDWIPVIRPGGRLPTPTDPNALLKTATVDADGQIHVTTIGGIAAARADLGLCYAFPLLDRHGRQVSFADGPIVIQQRVRWASGAFPTTMGMFGIGLTDTPNPATVQRYIVGGFRCSTGGSPTGFRAFVQAGSAGANMQAATYVGVPTLTYVDPSLLYYAVSAGVTGAEPYLGAVQSSQNDGTWCNGYNGGSSLIMRGPAYALIYFGTFDTTAGDKVWPGFYLDHVIAQPKSSVTA